MIATLEKEKLELVEKATQDAQLLVNMSDLTLQLENSVHLNKENERLIEEQKNKITQMRRRLKNSASTKKRREKSSKLQQENEQLKKLLEDVTKGKNQNQSEL